MIRLTRAAAACVLAFSVAAPALACMPPETTLFRKYPVEMYSGARKPVDFSSHPTAAALDDADKERVRKAVDAGANFAGAYRLLHVPCGNGCTAMLVVSLETGKILRVPFESNTFAEYRVGSKLLLLRSPHHTAIRRIVFDRGEFHLQHDS
jgi:hypothetical protein